MRLKLLAAAIFLVILLAYFLFPNQVETKEGFFLKVGNAADDISVLSDGFFHDYSFLKPAGADIVCFEGKTISFIASGEISALDMPLIFAEQKFCSDAREIMLRLEKRGDFVALQKV